MSEDIVYELSNNCRCTATDDDGNELKDENGYTIAANYCDGCWEDDLLNTKYEVVMPWLKANDIAEHDYIHISVNRATWQNVDGYGVGKATMESILKLLTFDGDWTLKLTYDGDKTLTAQRWSHDEPMGTGIFNFRLATEEEVEEWQYR
jgi:hypothetical protein